jgi:hypothetical protein
MSKFIRHKKKDRNHKELVEYFRANGATVDDVSALPDIGYDIIVCYRGVVVFTEIKDGEKPPSARKLTESEEAAALRHGEKFAVVETIEQARGLLDSIREHT